MYIYMDFKNICILSLAGYMEPITQLPSERGARWLGSYHIYIVVPLYFGSFIFIAYWADDEEFKYQLIPLVIILILGK